MKRPAGESGPFGEEGFKEVQMQLSITSDYCCAPAA